MHRLRLLLVILLAVGLARTVCAEAEGNEEPAADRPEKLTTHKFQVGFVVTGVGGASHNLFATVPVPMDWPEQEVRILEEETSPNVKSLEYRTIDAAVKQMLVEIPRLEQGEEARAVITCEVKRQMIPAPSDTARFQILQRLDREIKQYLNPSPYIESRHAAIRSLAREIGADKATTWEKVEALYDHVRDNVDYRPGRLKGALRALRDGYGDCEELSSLFIALCRASGVPARTVWVPGHCYPEFYLADESGEGRWFPCQAAGARAFGEIPEELPILQKGDNFQVPEKPKTRLRYVAEYLHGYPAKGAQDPKVQWVREMLE